MILIEGDAGLYLNLERLRFRLMNLRHKFLLKVLSEMITLRPFSFCSHHCSTGLCSHSSLFICTRIHTHTHTCKTAQSRVQRMLPIVCFFFLLRCRLFCFCLLNSLTEFGKASVSVQGDADRDLTEASYRLYRSALIETSIIYY